MAVLLPAAAIQGGRRSAFFTQTRPSLILKEEMDSNAATGRLFIQEGAPCGGDVPYLFTSGESFASSYVLGSKLGEGGFGKVFEAHHCKLGLPRAVKRLVKSADGDSWQNEVTALQALDHPHIVRLIECFDEAQSMYLVFELCEGPDLLSRIASAPGGRLSEPDASLAMRHILKALQCCHSQYRGHYDIKPENFMYATQDLDDLKMIDLGISSGFDRKHSLQGTPLYMAPEFWCGVYGPEGDVWSCGVVLFMMLTGQPFLPDVPPDVMRRELKVRARIKERLDSAAEEFSLSKQAIDLLGSMLQHDRHARPTVREALRHPFTEGSYEVEDDNVGRQVCPNVLGATELLQRLPQLLRQWMAMPLFKRAARLVLAHCGPSCPAERLAFRMLDQHGYGELSISLFEQDFHRRDAEIPSDFESLFSALDLNGDGYIGFLAFMGATLPVSMISDELCKVAFHVMDQGKDGFLDAKDFAAVCGHPSDSKICQEIFEEVCSEERMNVDRFIRVLCAN